MRFLLTLVALAKLSLYATATCPSGPVINDGGFESGVTPPTSGGNAWNVVGIVGDKTSYTLTTPGSTNNGGRVAFTALLTPGHPRYGGQSSLTLFQFMHTCTGKNYSIALDYNFNSTASNKCTLRLEYPFQTSVGSVTVPSGLGTPGVWYTTGSTFQSVSPDADRLRIIFNCNDATNRISVDNVKVELFNGNAY
ncbi:MAG: hypothetical protein LQ342_006039 [Letrouitia transgressa]|nr:MAG: hypothetical protein LQ342_006039 [Letrouitia transgressa]